MISTLDITALDQIDTALSREGVARLERGGLLLFRNLTFPLSPEDRDLIQTRRSAGRAKNISCDAAGQLRGSSLEGPAREQLAGMMTRYAMFAETLVRTVAPQYRRGLRRGRTSFRPAEVRGRMTSWRKDDTKRHVDAFPAAPTQGARILRVFCNVDQQGAERVWRVGPDFEQYARRFMPARTRLLPGVASLMSLAGITKTRRTRYDQAMLALHDASKRDLGWQASEPATEIRFSPGDVWMVFTDQIPHAAISGRNALEQTFLVAPERVTEPAHSPLAVLSRLTGADMTQRMI